VEGRAKAKSADKQTPRPMPPRFGRGFSYTDAPTLARRYQTSQIAEKSHQRPRPHAGTPVSGWSSNSPLNRAIPDGALQSTRGLVPQINHQHPFSRISEHALGIARLACLGSGDGETGGGKLSLAGCQPRGLNKGAPAAPTRFKLERPPAIEPHARSRRDRSSPGHQPITDRSSVRTTD
jgi:hypothetical protein